jgi:hypothetical protein
MMKRLLPCLFAGFLAVTVAGLAEAQSPAASHIGVIDLRLAYSNLEETLDTENQLTELQGQIDKLSESGKSGAKADSSGAAQTVQQQQMLRVKMARTQARQLTRGYEQIHAAVTAVAKERGFDVVMVAGSPELTYGAEMNEPQTLAGLIFEHNVLYVSDEIDITAEVIGRVNKGYKSPGDSTPRPALPTTSMRVGSSTYQLEIAGDDASREHGLMQRDTLSSDRGMIFVFQAAQMQIFWMRHTRIPLDIIFADENGKIVSISRMKPYDETPIPSDAPAKYAIELNAGQAAASGVKAGDTLQIPPAVDAALKQ